jgi:hypothetical protein
MLGKGRQRRASRIDADRNPVMARLGEKIHHLKE